MGAAMKLRLSSRKIIVGASFMVYHKKKNKNCNQHYSLLEKTQLKNQYPLGGKWNVEFLLLKPYGCGRTKIILRSLLLLLSTTRIDS